MATKLILCFFLLLLLGSCFEESIEEKRHRFILEEEIDSYFSTNLIFKSSIDTSIIIDKSIFYNTQGGLCCNISDKNLDTAISHLKCSDLLIEYDDGNFDFISEICKPKDLLNNFFPFPLFERTNILQEQDNIVEIKSLDISIIKHLRKQSSKFRLIIYTNYYDDQRGTISISDSLVSLGDKYLYKSEFADLDEAYQEGKFKYLDFVFYLD